MGRYLRACKYLVPHIPFPFLSFAADILAVTILANVEIGLAACRT
jgi:hypothetical protein